MRRWSWIEIFGLDIVSVGLGSASSRGAVSGGFSFRGPRMRQPSLAGRYRHLCNIRIAPTLRKGDGHEDYQAGDDGRRAAAFRAYSWRSLQSSIGRYAILRVETDDGIVGLGEAPVLPDWGGEHGRYFGEDTTTVAHLVREYFEPMLTGCDPRTVKELLAQMDMAVRGYPYAKAMIESALLDIAGARPVSRFISCSAAQRGSRCRFATASASRPPKTRRARPATSSPTASACCRSRYEATGTSTLL